MTPQEAGLDGLHKSDCWGPLDCPDAHADCKEIVQAVIDGIEAAGYEIKPVLFTEDAL